MTKTQFNLLLKKWTKILGLSSWKIIVVYENCEDESSYMEIRRSVDYQRARLIIPLWVIGERKPPTDTLIPVKDMTKDFWEESLVHELLHLVVTPMAVVTREDLEGFLHRDVMEMIDRSFRHAEERVVDSLSVSLCKAFRNE